MSHLPISTIIPTYNRPHLVTRAVESAITASAPEDEIIVVDDGSATDTEAVLKPFNEKIRYYRITNSGLASARNFGIRQSTKDLVAFLDDDDEWIPEKLTLQRQFMQARPDILFCFSNFYSQFSDGKRRDACVFSWGQRIQSWEQVFNAKPERYSTIANLPNSVRDFDVYSGNIYYHQMLDDYVLPTTLVIRRSSDFDPACFKEGMRFLESWECSSRLAGLGKAAYLDFDTACQHGHDGPRLTDADELTKVSTRLTILESQWGKNEAFLEHHEEAYYRRLDEERILLIKELIASKQLKKAQTEITKLHRPIKIISAAYEFLYRKLRLKAASILSKRMK